MHPRIFVPERNVWRVAKAERAAVLIDGAAFFGVVRSAFLRAQRRIFIVGWDIDPTSGDGKAAGRGILVGIV
jgi:hypothetical protein